MVPPQRTNPANSRSLPLLEMAMAINLHRTQQCSCCETVLRARLKCCSTSAAGLPAGQGGVRPA